MESWFRSFEPQTKLRLPISRPGTRNSSRSRDSEEFLPICRPAASRQFQTLEHSEWNGARQFPSPIKHCCSALASGKKCHHGTNKNKNLFPELKRKSH